ncbi:putative protein of unknown function (DUF4586) [Monocercomonoides exilis]|uniref:putative protein of unknown function (DUF4586) n=1 Tax=Monocercomonoides exilis TaxID=2049356 RepID=UPI00355A4D16|nr:putative protein of unknown function (DUF4586) [Monocercomonoides exilis]|eukprot:MONOS_3909.1-p1 / transcript=MONOS_3909.1 / gene=MONOS_3909 / organism=Monocercomonoides_exilis_PA203 / gene_product=unspecified product / transcript_product=unspecified product / location=Mono_scaffold00097:7367-8895(+) / protein_length=399 / sequence_SO=supercontig / SO=protein_coding / is_pseudo=false
MMTAAHDLRYYNVFSQPKYESDTPENADDIRLNTIKFQKHFKPFLTMPYKKGQTPDIYLEKSYKPLYVGEKYKDPSKIEFERNLKEKSKRITSKPFVPSNPTKKSSTPGDTYGLIDKSQAILPAQTEIPKALQQTLPQRKQQEKPNIVTSPAKKGGAGFYHLTIHGDEFEYISPVAHSKSFSETRSRSVRPRAKSSNSTATARPFVSTSRRGIIFDEKIYKDPQLSQEEIAKREKKKIEILSLGRTNEGFYAKPISLDDFDVVFGDKKKSETDKPEFSSSSKTLQSEQFYKTSEHGMMLRSYKQNAQTLSKSSAKSASFSKTLGSTTTTTKRRGSTPQHPKPFCSASSRVETFSSFPSYISDPFDIKRKSSSVLKPFMPSGTNTHSKLTPPIMGSQHYT